MKTEIRRLFPLTQEPFMFDFSKERIQDLFSRGQEILGKKHRRVRFPLIFYSLDNPPVKPTLIATPSVYIDCPLISPIVDCLDHLTFNLAIPEETLRQEVIKKFEHWNNLGVMGYNSQDGYTVKQDQGGNSYHHHLTPINRNMVWQSPADEWKSGRADSSSLIKRVTTGGVDFEASADFDIGKWTAYKGCYGSLFPRKSAITPDLLNSFNYLFRVCRIGKANLVIGTEGGKIK